MCIAYVRMEKHQAPRTGLEESPESIHRQEPMYALDAPELKES